MALVICFAVVLDKCVRDSVPGADARKAAVEWVKLVDDGKYAESWDQASETFKSGVGKDAWVGELEQVRGRLGKLKSRRLAAAKFDQQASGLYDIVHFQSSFEHQPIATERVVPMLEPDGKWRVSGYFVREGQNPQSLFGNAGR